MLNSNLVNKKVSKQKLFVLIIYPKSADIETMDNNQFWERVKTLSKEHHLTQQEICNLIGILLGTLKGWITNNRLPDAEGAVSIANVFHTTVEYLVTGNQSSEREKADKLVKDIQDLLTAYNS